MPLRLFLMQARVRGGAWPGAARWRIRAQAKAARRRRAQTGASAGTVNAAYPVTRSNHYPRCSMNHAIRKSLTVLSALLLASGLAACNAFGILGEDENEVRVVVESKGASSIDADDGHTYEVTSGTEFEGYASFADVAVGHTVEIEWEPASGSDNRRALEIEAGDHDDNGDDDGD
jgi:hypothetical protein